MARPSHLNDITLAKIVESIKLGASYALAAQSAGITERTMYRWMARGESRKKGILRRFWKSVKEAEGARANSWLKTIEIASVTDWKAAAWKLERCYPQLYGRYMRTELSGPNGTAIKQDVNRVDVSKMPHEDLIALEALLSKADKPRDQDTALAQPGQD